MCRMFLKNRKYFNLFTKTSILINSNASNKILEMSEYCVIYMIKLYDTETCPI